MKSITLIGMPGVGKTAVGKLLAKKTGYSFLDTDQELASKLGCTLQFYINKKGHQAFLRKEEAYLCQLRPKTAHVISTGGSAVYSELGMSNLKQFSIIIFLEDTLHNILTRVRNLETRGIVHFRSNHKQNNIKTLFYERKPLYQRYEDLTIDVQSFNKIKLVDTIIKTLKEKNIG